MESEIAELESFIDSYVGEDETDHIQSKTFTNSSAKEGVDDFYDKDFEEELKEHQRHQDFLLNNEPFHYGLNDMTDSIDFMPHAYAYPASLDNGSTGSVKSQMHYHQNPLFTPFDDGGTIGATAFSNGGVHPPPQSFYSYQYLGDGSEIPSVPYVENATSSPSLGSPKYIAKNDLRRRLNSKKQGNSHGGSEQREVSRRKNAPPSRGRHGKNPPESRLISNSSNGRNDRARLNINDKGTYQHQRTYDSQHSRHSSQSSSSESVGCSKSGIVSGRSKSEVVSWLHQDASGKQSVVQQLKNMKISKNSDLLKLVKSANSYITSEGKMKEVAMMICTKAMRNPLTAESGALLCNEMSQRMVNGTSFRTVLLNIVQGHFKNRRQLISRAIENDKDNEWCGFVNFLAQLFLHLRTLSNEKLKALVNPVYDCLFLTLEEKSLNHKLSKCFLDNYKIAGPSLNESNPQKMSQLMSILRDKCVLPGNLLVEVRRNLLQCLEYYARGWKSHALDASYYAYFCDE